MLIDSMSRWLKRILQAAKPRTIKGSKTPTFRPWLESLEERCTPTVVTLTPSADNTLYQDTTGGTTSNGAGQHLFSGDTNSHGLRRAVLKFDLSSVPAGATINSVSMTLFVTRAGGGGPSETTVLRRLTRAWGEGTSNATFSTEGDG